MTGTGRCRPWTPAPRGHRRGAARGLDRRGLRARAGLDERRGRGGDRRRRRRHLPGERPAKQVRPLDATALERRCSGSPRRTLRRARAIRRGRRRPVAGLCGAVPTLDQRVTLTWTSPWTRVRPTCRTPRRRPASDVPVRDLVARRQRRRRSERAGTIRLMPPRRPARRHPRPSHPADCVVSRILGVDLGSKRVGLAVADAGIGIARPLATVNRGDTLDADATALGRVCREQDVTELVVGLPIEARGNEGEMAAGARAWAAACGAPRASGDDARRAPDLVQGRAAAGPDAPRPLGRAALTHPAQRLRARIDREAASVILQDELDARRAPHARHAGDPRRGSGR